MTCSTCVHWHREPDPRPKAERTFPCNRMKSAGVRIEPTGMGTGRVVTPPTFGCNQWSAR